MNIERRRDDGSKLTELINCKTMRSCGKHNQPLRQALIRLLTTVTSCPRALYWPNTWRSECLQFFFFFAHLRSAMINYNRLLAAKSQTNFTFVYQLDCLWRPQKSRSHATPPFCLAVAFHTSSLHDEARWGWKLNFTHLSLSCPANYVDVSIDPPPPPRSPPPRRV